MKTRHLYEKSKWYLILTGVLSLTVLGINLLMLTKLFENVNDTLETAQEIQNLGYSSARPAAVMLFAALVVLHLVQGIASIRESRLLFLKHLIYILLSCAAAFLLFVRGDSPDQWPFACLLYFLAAFISCVISVVRKRNKWNILLLILMLVVLFLGGCAYLAASFAAEVQGSGAMLSVLLVFLLVDVQGVSYIVPIAFAHIRMDILKKIIKKTYAAEILLGIVLLIVAFSFILPAFEPDINDFGDALWYCFAIVTTIGFGDIAATTVIGRILSVILGAYGIIVVSLITSIIVNFYGEMKKEEDRDEGDADETVRNAGAKEVDGKKHLIITEEIEL